MKKILILALSLFFLLCLNCCSGCDDKENEKITVTGANGTEYESYKEACRVQDFDAAHKILDKMKEQDPWRSSTIREAENYIFNYEINALIAINSEEANTRIVFLLNEITIEGSKPVVGDNYDYFNEFAPSCRAFNEKCNKILSLAISMKNQDMAKKIIPLYKEDLIIENKGGNYYVKEYTYDTKKAAQLMYDEAVKSGAFDE